MAFTSQQLDALAAYAATSITLAKELAPDYPTMAATVEQNAEAVKAWADSSPGEQMCDSLVDKIMSEDADLLHKLAKR